MRTYKLTISGKRGIVRTEILAENEALSLSVGEWITDRELLPDPNEPEPDPISNDYPAVWELVIADMKGRDDHGRKLYGTPLQPYNGRNALIDAYQEALDLAVYLRQKIFEETGH